ncbi:hypothetical protein PTTG_25257 [Puccinia triticina 1-1 BBBD Race 1]|uniref:CBM1 domain-containing protein n=2 Tax=Puccinia triticina TaxID=208348 RepID=A0A180H528_PUCT1|nr:uncharacterized protein PtA15_2A510 [Puccinia triticina]OAV99699.1 hypothetical protein PTTG_25257 [Puccinia triticina 1-1 BBBD Race 1]WAQ82193.1 hypothetical protein PtA15_2A510 [Puccinia triticina]WAR53050.1 hypothetical protein PtB15_2B479 [Puccinia triticina]
MHLFKSTIGFAAVIGLASVCAKPNSNLMECTPDYPWGYCGSIDSYTSEKPVKKPATWKIIPAAQTRATAQLHGMIYKRCSDPYGQGAWCCNGNLNPAYMPVTGPRWINDQMLKDNCLERKTASQI